jgi:beta-phosphoglucomutase-like phosphatase (HAD superfamily)
VTNAPRLNAEFVLKVLGIEDIFPTIVLAEEEIAAKPDPLPYQIGLKRLGVNASEAIALEDSHLILLI